MKASSASKSDKSDRRPKKSADNGEGEMDIVVPKEPPMPIGPTASQLAQLAAGDGDATADPTAGAGDEDDLGVGGRHHDLPPSVFAAAYTIFGTAVAASWWLVRPRPFRATP